jgi:hypothetical protein
MVRFCQITEERTLNNEGGNVMSKSVSPLVRKTIRGATPSQLLKLRAVLNDPSKVCDYDGYFLYDDIIEKAKRALDNGRLEDKNLLRVLECLVNKNALAEVFK